jgi:hypothetical protein
VGAADEPSACSVAAEAEDFLAKAPSTSNEGHDLAPYARQYTPPPGGRRRPSAQQRPHGNPLTFVGRAPAQGYARVACLLQDRFVARLPIRLLGLILLMLAIAVPSCQALLQSGARAEAPVERTD